MENEILTVTQFNALVNQTLSYAYPQVVIEGEVSDFKINQNKWVFFDLKDENSSLSCFMSIYNLKTRLEDGMLIKVIASPNITKWGKFSLTVRDIELSGEGSVKKAFELMKTKLEEEGLFDESRKRALPIYPQKIALITSRQAAAYSDFLSITSDRWSGLEISHAQVQVQGLDAPSQIVRAIKYFNQKPKEYDLMVIIRGGGSLEDLQSFNHEDVVRAIYGSKIRSLVGIGHEDDVCLAELAADLRAATPTDAARLLTPDKKTKITELKAIIDLSYQNVSTLIKHKNTFTEGLSLVFAELNSNLKDKLIILSSEINKQIGNITTTTQARISHLTRLLKGLDPRNILSRGFAIARVNGKIIKSPKQVKTEDTVMLQLLKGKLSLIKKQ